MSKSLSERANEKLREKDDKGSENFSNSNFSFTGGNIPSAPPEMGMSTPNGAMGRLGMKKKSDYGDFEIGGTGISIDTPEGRINKLASVDANYEKDGFSAGVTKPIGGRGNPRFQVGYKTSFKKGGKVRSSASKKADGIATKGHTKGKII
jgi:hypothetical protein